MGTDSRAVTPEIVRRVAELARLRVPDADLRVWTDQLARIVSYIDQIEQIPEREFGPLRDPPPTPVRPDEARNGQGDQALRENAPRRFEGFGVVPRVVGSAE